MIINMGQPPQECDNQGIYGSAPSLDIQQRAIAALKAHPQYMVAASHSWCVPKVKIIPTHFIERLPWGENEKANTFELLKGCDHFILVSYFTAATAQEARSGSGTIYDFALHPKTMEMLHASTSFWIC